MLLLTGKKAIADFQVPSCGRIFSSSIFAYRAVLGGDCLQNVTYHNDVGVWIRLASVPES